jgi:hypothetical protein
MTTRVPVFEYKHDAQGFQYRWNNVVSGFSMPVKVAIANGEPRWLKPTGLWQALPGTFKADARIAVDENFYVFTRQY